jgi:hypothetical protein
MKAKIQIPNGWSRLPTGTICKRGDRTLQVFIDDIDKILMILIDKSKWVVVDKIDKKVEKGELMIRRVKKLILNFE